MNKIITNLNILAGTMEINEDTFIDNIIFNNDSNLTIIIKEGASLTFGNKVQINNLKSHLKIICEENSSCLFHLGIEAQENNNLTIEAILNGNNINCEIKIRVIGDTNSKTVLQTIGTLKKDTQNNNFLEDVKYLNENESYILCMPDLLVDTDDVTANHNVTISSISDDDLFYLECKGISKDKSKKILREGFINSMIIKREEESDEY